MRNYRAKKGSYSGEIKYRYIEGGMKWASLKKSQQLSVVLRYLSFLF